MNANRCILALTALFLVVGFTPVHAADKVLLAGDPPLTQDMVDQYQERWQWYCDIQMSELQRKEHQRLLVNFWLRKNRAYRQALAQAYDRSHKRYFEDLQ